MWFIFRALIKEYNINTNKWQQYLLWFNYTESSNIFQPFMWPSLGRYNKNIITNTEVSEPIHS
jgi:hypothetical protein